MIDAKLSLYTSVINDLHAKWRPHDGQIKIGHALFNDNVKQIFAQCGRKFGKTDFIAYSMWRYCLLNPGSACYYIAPFQKQAREIIWANKRIQRFGPEKYLASLPNNTEMRLSFKNDSFIKLDGSDNYEAYRGVNPHFICYDEFKDFHPDFHLAMEPNLATHDAPLIIIGTPPEKECQYTELAKEFSTTSYKKFFQMPTWYNPYISKDWLQRQKEILFRRGEEDVWYREYEAKFVFGGRNSIFPMLNDGFIHKYELLVREIDRDKKKLKWYVMADPGTTTCFAMLFIAVNPYSKMIYLLDEIYETDSRETSVGKIGKKFLSIKDDLNKRYPWTQVSDEAAAWFRSEIMSQFQEYFAPTNKALKKKEEGLSLIKDILLMNKIKISDRCVKTFWEMENYVKDRNGDVPKENDHQIDNLRYFLSADFYSLLNEAEPRTEAEKPNRGYRISDDFPGLDDWGRSVYDVDDISIEDEVM